MTVSDQAEIKIRHMEEELHKLSYAVEHCPSIVMITDKNGIIEYVNSKFLHLTGYSREEISGKNARELEDQCSNERQQMWDTLTSGSEWRGKLVNQKKSGEIYWEFAFVSPIKNQAGERTNFLKVAEDITLQEKMEEKLLKASKLESLAGLAGNIAHEFNNVLTAILGNISLAKMEIEPQSEIFKILTEAEKASQRAKDLTWQLLTFAKEEPPVNQTTSAAELIMDSVSSALRGSNCGCIFALPDELWKIKVDDVQINQVINNLIINADEAMAEGGMINIWAENITLKAHDQLPLKEGLYVKIAIQDQGIGIPEKYRPKIFDPYFTTKQKGRGLGLAIVHSIIKNHNGHIEIESRPGEGTTVYLYLQASSEEMLKKTIEEENAMMGKGKILIMDDEEIVRNVAGQMLKHLGYQVDFAEEGAKALELYQQAWNSEQPFDAVVLDLTVPKGMGGLELFKQLLQINPAVKAILSSGYSSDPIISNYQKYGFSGVIAKPYQIQEFSSTIHKVLNAVDG